MAVSSRTPDSRVESLANLGPRSAAILASVGVTTLEELRALGAVATYVRAKRSGHNVSLNLLWALEGALIGMHWQEVAREHRTRLLMALEDCDERRASGQQDRPPERQ